MNAKKAMKENDAKDPAQRPPPRTIFLTKYDAPLNEPQQPSIQPAPMAEPQQSSSTIEQTPIPPQRTFVMEYKRFTSRRVPIPQPSIAAPSQASESKVAPPPQASEPKVVRKNVSNYLPENVDQKEMPPRDEYSSTYYRATDEPGIADWKRIGVDVKPPPTDW